MVRDMSTSRGDCDENSKMEEHAELLQILGDISNEDNLSEFHAQKVLMVLTKLKATHESHSMLELLLILHYCLADPCVKDKAYYEVILFPYENNDNNSIHIMNIFTLMKDILVMMLKNDSEKFVKEFDSHCRSDYQVQLLFVLIDSVSLLRSFLAAHEDMFEETLNQKFLDTFIQILNNCQILVSRHGWCYRKKWIPRSNMDFSHPYLIPRRFMFFNFYSDSTKLGCFPHIFWQETPLNTKISHGDSLDVIFANGNEDKCCVCLQDKGYKENFAIFLNCSHILCVSCAEYLLVDVTKSRNCPMCRTDIRCWTTKKIVQQTLEEQRQQEDDSQDELKKQKQVSLEEQRNQEDICCKLKSTSNEIFSELCSLASPVNFIESLKSLHDMKNELSLLEILLILKSNLALDTIMKHFGMSFLEKFQHSSDIILVLQLIKCTSRFIQNKVLSGHQMMHSQGCIDNVIQSQCFNIIKLTVQQIGSHAVNVFPDHRSETLRLLSEIVKIIEETKHLYKS